MHDILRQDPETWRLFTCAEEYNSTFRDGYDRFPHYLSTNREPFVPLASQYLVGQGYRPEYPDGQPFAVCLTHDIDAIYRSAVSKGYAALVALKKGDFTKDLASARQICSILCIEFPHQKTHTGKKIGEQILPEIYIQICKLVESKINSTTCF